MACMREPDRYQVFLAYSRRDLDLARRFVGLLEAEGFTVWWDVGLLPIGVAFEEGIFSAIGDAACVIVLWTSTSIQSEWVLREAEFAQRERKLLPVLMEPVELPRQFSRIQAADLSGGAERGNPAFRRLIAAARTLVDTAPGDADQTLVYKASQRSAERRAEALLQRNLRSETRIEHLTLQGTAFHDELNWNLQPGVNVLLGRNGYGKTFLLRGLVALLQYSDRAAAETLGEGTAAVELMSDEREQTILYANHFFDEEAAVGQLPVLAIPDTRFVNRSVTSVGAVTDKSTGSADRADLARYGAWHFLEEQPYENMIQTLLYGLCLDAVEAGGSFEAENFQLIRDVVRELTDNSFAFDRVVREGRNRFTLFVYTEGNEKVSLPIQKASQGTASVIALIGLIYDFLKSLHLQSEASVTRRSAIVIIDEIDAHLHPVWQHKLVTLLRERFPRVQFILTAHNPIVVAGCLEDEVSVLRKNPGAGFSLVQFPNDFVGWSTEAIYRKVFEIEDPDASFARYDALRPFRGQLREEVEALVAQATRTAEEEQALERLEEQLRYIDKVETTRTERLTQEELERENRQLRDRLEGMGSAHERATRADAELQALREALAQAQALAAEAGARHERQLRRWPWLTAAAASIVALVTTLLSRF